MKLKLLMKINFRGYYEGIQIHGIKKKQYLKKVKSRINELKEWCSIEYGLTDTAIVNRLEIQKEDFYMFKQNEKEFRDIIESRPKYLQMLTGYKSYVKPHLNDIKDWVNSGISLDMVAKKLGISFASLLKYRKEEPELNDILEINRTLVVDRLKKTLIERAIGFEREEIKQVVEKYGEGQKAKVKTKIEKTKKYIYSDNCLIFALKNLAPDEFSDYVKQDINVSNDGFIEALKATADDVWGVKDEDFTNNETE